MTTKKIFLIFILTIFLSGAFSFAAGQTEGPANCCKIKHTIAIKDDKGNEITIVAGSVVRTDDTTATCDLSPTGGAKEEPRSDWAIFCTLDAIYTITDIVNVVALVLAGAVFMIAGILFISAGGSSKMVEKAKSFFSYGFIGVGIIILSKFILALVRFFFGI